MTANGGKPSARPPDTAATLDGAALAIDANGAPRLIGTQCGACGARLFPPVEVCPDCLAEAMRPLPLGRRGTLYSWSVVHAAPPGWRLPYIAAYVDLPEGVRVFAHIVGAEAHALAFDMAVRLTTAVLGTDAEGREIVSYAFTPAGEGGA